MTLLKNIEAKIDESKLQLSDDLISAINHHLHDFQWDLHDEYENCPEDYPNAFLLRSLVEEIEEVKVSLEISYKQ